MFIRARRLARALFDIAQVAVLLVRKQVAGEQYYVVDVDVDDHHGEVEDDRKLTLGDE